MSRVKIGVVAALVVAVSIAGYVVATGSTTEPTDPVGTFGAAVAHRGRVGWYGTSPRAPVPGTRFEPIAPSSALGLALASADPSVVRRALDAAGLRTVVLELAPARAATPDSFLGRLGRFGSFPGFRTVVLETGLVVVEIYVLPEFSEAERAALPRVARQILAGGTPPRISQFPAHLRAPIPVEVMLALRRSDGGLALWRSARASSVASGLLTATRVAMERWHAREGNLGSQLATALPGFDVEVSLLVDDGTIATRADGFVDQVVGEDYGVAFDNPSSWHYLLPTSPERVGARTGSAAFRALFADTQRRADSISDSSIRLYRLRVLPLGVDRAVDASRR